MATIFRADGVMRTGVIRPFVGYNPSIDVQTVAQAFTTGGPLATTLGAPFGAGPIAQWWANLKARIAARKMAKAAMKTATSPVVSGSPGPEMPVASQVAPQMQTQMIALQRFSNPGHARGPIAQAATALARRRYFTYYRAG